MNCPSKGKGTGSEGGGGGGGGGDAEGRCCLFSPLLTSTRCHVSVQPFCKGWCGGGGGRACSTAVPPRHCAGCSWCWCIGLYSGKALSIQAEGSLVTVKAASWDTPLLHTVQEPHFLKPHIKDLKSRMKTQKPRMKPQAKLVSIQRGPHRGNCRCRPLCKSNAKQTVKRQSDSLNQTIGPLNQTH